jgi:hypothetical protein
MVVAPTADCRKSQFSVQLTAEEEMVEENNAVAIIPGDCFRWRARVQFIESFQTRAAAMDFAFEHGCNLIVERNEGSSQLFDVLEDPDRACTADFNLELLANEEVLVEPASASWTLLMFWSLWNLVRQFGATMARVYISQVAPRLRQVTSRQQWASIQSTLRLAWYRYAHWNIRNLKQRVGATVSLYRAEITRQYRHAASRYWWSGLAVDFRRWLHRHSQGSGLDVARRLAAVVSSFYSREIAPRLRQAAIKIRQADYEAIFRGAARVSISTGRDLSRSFKAASSNLYRQEVVPRLRHTATWMRQADYKGAIRHAWSIILLTAIRLADRFAASVAALYVREVAPRLHRAAARYQQAEIEEAFRRSIGAVAPPQHSNSSQRG